MKKEIVYGFAVSTYVRTVLMTCAEKNVDYELTAFEFSSPGPSGLLPFSKMLSPFIEWRPIKYGEHGRRSRSSVTRDFLETHA